MSGKDRKDLAPRLAAAFARPRAGRAALIPYLTAGFPDMATSDRLVAACVAAGADIVELGVPFSDPVADGPVVQRTDHAALEAGVTTDDVLALAARHAGAVPFVLLTYLNPVLAYGPGRFFAAAAAAGVEAVVIPDLPVDEATAGAGEAAGGEPAGGGETAAAAGSPPPQAGPSPASLVATAAAHGVAYVPLAAPTATDARLDLVAAAAASFVYCVTVTGVTGPRQRLGEDLPRLVARLRERTRRPLAAGFGIADPAQAAAAARLADGVIVGSALLARVMEAGSATAACGAVAGLLETMAAAIAAA